MLLRLFLCVLLATIGCPGAATDCHAAPAPGMAMAAGAPMQHHHAATPPHACIGCIPPETLRAPVAGALALAAARPMAYALAALDPDAGTPPALPPPRA
jgi:hypothetical protein